MERGNPMKQETQAYGGSEVERIAILGGARMGGASLVIDVISRIPTQRAVAIFDSDPRVKGHTYLGVPVVGSTDDVDSRYREGLFDSAVIAIGSDMEARERLFIHLTAAGVPFANVIDLSARLRLGVSMGKGNVVLPGCHLGTGTSLGNNVFMVSNTSIEHHSTIGDHSYFSTSCSLASWVKVGTKVRFDMRSGARPEISIGDGARIGPGVLLLSGVPAGAVVETQAAYSVRLPDGASPGKR